MLNVFKKYWDTRLFFVVLTWIVAVALVGMFDLFSMSFDADRLKDPDYWAEVITLITAGVLVFAMTLFNAYMTLRSGDEENIKQLNTLTTSLSKAGTDSLPEFVNIENNERRKTAYKEKISTQYQNLISKMTVKYPKSLDTWLNGTKKEKEADEHCVKLMRYEALMNEKYLEDNKYNLPASFIRITPNFIQSGVNKAKENSANENPANGLRTAVTDNWLNFLMPVVTTSVIIGMVLTTTDESNWIFVFMLLVKTFALLVQRTSALIYSEVFYKKTYVSDLGFRYRLVERYLKWCRDNNKIKVKEAKTDANKQHTSDNN